MTERLYYRDARQRTFTARLVSVGGEGHTAYLDRSAFYPTSGGQPNDTGMLAGVRVTDVIDEGDRIAHVLATALEHEPGSEVFGEIDWERRHDHMQQHTGQHLLSAVLEDQLGLRTASVHFGPEASTLDVADASGGASVLQADVLADIELRTNTIVSDARPVIVTFEDAARVTGLRKPVDRPGELRIVSIEGVDRSACGGTHVATTAQIGAVLLRRQEKVRQGLRIEFVCGDRAIHRARRDLELLTRVARVYSASVDDAPRLVEANAAEFSALQAESRRLIEGQAKYRAAELHAAAPDRADGVRMIVERVTTGVDAVRSLALAFAPLSRAVFIAVSHTPPSVLVASSHDSGYDAGKTLRPLLEQVGGRGGGSARLAQGSVPTPALVDQVVDKLVIRTDDS